MRSPHGFSVGAGAAALLLMLAVNVMAADTDAATAAVMAVDQHWLDAELDGDTAWLDAMLLPEYRSVGADGVVHAKAAIVAHAAKNRGDDSERRRVDAWRRTHPSGQAVVIRGDTAILTFYDPARGPQKGVRSADVFIRVDGRWRALYSQHTAAGTD